MSKKKNTLKDLDDFLKQQAASLVSPEKLPSTPTTRDQEVENTAGSIIEDTDSAAQFIKAMQNDNGRLSHICDAILGSYEHVRDLAPEEKMLVNTALYIKNPKNWKDAITTYWRNHK